MAAPFIVRRCSKLGSIELTLALHLIGAVRRRCRVETLPAILAIHGGAVARIDGRLVHQSLHAQGEVFQLKYLAQQADAILDGIDDLIAATERVAPVRTSQPYALVREAAGAPTNEEGRWERAIWSEWNASRPEDFLPGVCSKVKRTVASSGLSPAYLQSLITVTP